MAVIVPILLGTVIQSAGGDFLPTDGAATDLHCGYGAQQERFAWLTMAQAKTMAQRRRIIGAYATFIRLVAYRGLSLRRGSF